jgi:hypothetical protein
MCPETPVDAPPMAAVREALRQVLRGHEPYPALVVAATGTCSTPIGRSSCSPETCGAAVVYSRVP